MASVVVLMGGVFLAVRVAVGLDGILFFFGGGRAGNDGHRRCGEDCAEAKCVVFIHRKNNDTEFQ